MTALGWQFLPIQQVGMGSPIDFRAMVASAVARPGVAIVEAACLILMAIGTGQLGSWAYHAGFRVGLFLAS